MRRSLRPIVCLGVLTASTACLLAVAVGDQIAALAAIVAQLLLTATGAGCFCFGGERPLSEELRAQLSERDSWEAATQGAPRLGEILVYRYHWIRRADLDRALALQKDTGRLLGEILVDMRVISPRRLARALLEQRRLQRETAPSALPEG